MTDPQVCITLPYDPPATLTTAVYDDVDAVFGAGTDLVLEVQRERGIDDLAPWILLTAPLAFVGKIALETATEELLKKGFRNLVNRLRTGDPAGGPHDVGVADADDRVLFLFDEAADADPLAVPEMFRVRHLFSPPARLRWDTTTHCWRTVGPAR